MHNNYKLHEMKKAQTRVNKTQELLKVTCHLNKFWIFTWSKRNSKYIRKVYPSLSWEAALKTTTIEFELLLNNTMIHFFEKGIRRKVT